MAAEKGVGVNAGPYITERKTVRYLVHIVPDVHSACAFGPAPLVIFPSVELVQVLVPFPTVRIEEIDPGAASTPTPPFELASVLILDEQIEFLRFLVNGVVGGTLDVGIYNNDHLDKS